MWGKKNNMENKKGNEKLQLIPKTELYIEYMNNVILKLPRTEKLKKHSYIWRAFAPYVKEKIEII